MITLRRPPAVPGARSPWRPERVGRCAFCSLGGVPAAPSAEPSGSAVGRDCPSPDGASGEGCLTSGWACGCDAAESAAPAGAGAGAAAGAGSGAPLASALRAACSSTADAAAFTSSPASWSLASRVLDDIPCSLAISWTRFLAISQSILGVRVSRPPGFGRRDRAPAAGARGAGTRRRGAARRRGRGRRGWNRGLLHRRAGRGGRAPAGGRSCRSRCTCARERGLRLPFLGDPAGSLGGLPGDAFGRLVALGRVDRQRGIVELGLFLAGLGALFGGRFVGLDLEGLLDGDLLGDDVPLGSLGQAAVSRLEDLLGDRLLGDGALGGGLLRELVG